MENSEQTEEGIAEQVSKASNTLKINDCLLSSNEMSMEQLANLLLVLLEQKPIKDYLHPLIKSSQEYIG